MTFGEALEALKSGQRVQREGWNGKGIWLAYMPSMTIPGDEVNERTRRHLSAASSYVWIARSTSSAASAAAPTGLDVALVVGGYIVMWTAQGVWQPGWLASQADMLSDDWTILP